MKPDNMAPSIIKARSSDARKKANARSPRRSLAGSNNAPGGGGSLSAAHSTLYTGVTVNQNPQGYFPSGLWGIGSILAMIGLRNTLLNNAQGDDDNNSLPVRPSTILMPGVKKIPTSSAGSSIDADNFEEVKESLDSIAAASTAAEKRETIKRWAQLKAAADSFLMMNAVPDGDDKNDGSCINNNSSPPNRLQSEPTNNSPPSGINLEPPTQGVVSSPSTTSPRQVIGTLRSGLRSRDMTQTSEDDEKRGATSEKCGARRNKEGAKRMKKRRRNKKGRKKSKPVIKQSGAIRREAKKPKVRAETDVLLPPFLHLKSLKRGPKRDWHLLTNPRLQLDALIRRLERVS